MTTLTKHQEGTKALFMLMCERNDYAEMQLVTWEVIRGEQVCSGEAGGVV